MTFTERWIIFLLDYFIFAFFIHQSIISMDIVLFSTFSCHPFQRRITFILGGFLFSRDVCQIWIIFTNLLSRNNIIRICFLLCLFCMKTVTVSILKWLFGERGVTILMSNNIIIYTRGVSWNFPVLLIGVARDMYTFLWFGIYVIFFYGQ